MEPDSLAYLRENQVLIGLKLLRHCQILASALHGWTPSNPLPQGKDPENIVFEVIGKYLEGDRNFNPKWSIEIQLKRAIQRRLEWLRDEADSQSVSLDELMEEDEGACGASSGRPPDLEAADRIDAKVLWQMMAEYPQVKKDEDLQLLLMAIDDEGVSTPDDQAKATGLPLAQIYELRKKLKSVYRAILPEYHKGGILK